MTKKMVMMMMMMMMMMIMMMMMMVMIMVMMIANQKCFLIYHKWAFPYRSSFDINRYHPGDDLMQLNLIRFFGTYLCDKPLIGWPCMLETSSGMIDNAKVV